MPERRSLPLPEFVAMAAMLFSILAFSIDAMLPAFPQIAAELSPANANRVQLVILVFMLGMGLGTVVAGPLSDAFGRKSIMTLGLGIYIAGAIAAHFASSLDMLLAARALQGLGAAGPRIVTMAMMRDMYEGRRMAQIASFVMTVFMLVPAVAPALGAQIIAFAGWRFIFVAFVIFAVIGGLWLNLRQPETLPPERRRPMRLDPLKLAFAEVVGNRRVMIFTVVLTLGFGQMMGLLSSSQQIYDVTFDRAASFPYWFMLSAILATTGTLLNAALVLRLGMRRLALWAYAAQVVLASLVLVALWSRLLTGPAAFAAYYVWSVSIFFMAGLTFGNLNALALQPLGHVAGMAASVITAISTILAVAVAIPIGQAFDGTPVPVLLATVLCSGGAFLLMQRTTEDLAALGPAPVRPGTASGGGESRDENAPAD